MIIDQFKKVQVEAKTFHIYIKIRDEFGGSVTDQDGKYLVNKDDGYVPDFFPHYSITEKSSTYSRSNMGDYLILDIDLDTGQILNWKKPTKEQLEKFIGINKE